MNRKIVYFDMDGVLVNFQSGIDQLNHVDLELYKGNYDKVPNIFSTMKPNLDMISLWEQMVNDERYDCYILSTSPWYNATAASDKVEWVKKHIPSAFKRVILSHNKNLNYGHYLIDGYMVELSSHIIKQMTHTRLQSKWINHFGLGKNYRNIDMFISLQRRKKRRKY